MVFEVAVVCLFGDLSFRCWWVVGACGSVIVQMKTWKEVEWILPKMSISLTRIPQKILVSFESVLKIISHLKVR